MTEGWAPPEGHRLQAAERILRAASGDRIRTGVPLAPFTSFRIGGPAALFLQAEDEADLAGAAEAVARCHIPWLVLGKGSNVLVSDEGFAGLVLRLGRGFRWAARQGERLVAGAAMPLPALAGVALAHSLGGLEFGVAIPGSVGGAVRMNAGAHARAIEDVLEDIELYSLKEGSRSTLPTQEAGLSYRRSALPDGSIIVAASVKLRQRQPSAIRRAMEEARAWRRATQPVGEPNCGSVFKNPPGDHAARLIEAAGGKGLRSGGAVVSLKHANFIVAERGATARDVHDLIRLVQRMVQESAGVVLEPEVRLVGDFDLASRPR